MSVGNQIAPVASRRTFLLQLSWIALAMAFCALIYMRAGGEMALLFLTG